MNFSFKIKIPNTPNFITLATPAGQRQDGFQAGPQVPIADFTDDELKEIGRLWTEQLISTARMKRKP